MDEGKLEGRSVDNYMLVEKIGEGAYGTVFKAIDRTSKEIIALKKVIINEDGQGIPSSAMREMSILQELNHPNIVRLKNVITVKADYLYMAFEHMDMDLTGMLRKLDKESPLPLGLIKSLMYQTLDGLCHLHDKCIMHRDIKPSNLLVSMNGQLKICDFGLMRMFSLPSRTYTHEVVTMWYRAPELLLGSKAYSTSVDLWSCGTILAEMVLRKVFLPGDSEIDQLFRIFRVLGTPTSEVWQNCEGLPQYQAAFPKFPRQDVRNFFPELGEAGVLLMLSMLEYDPSMRITAAQSVEHDFLRGTVFLHVEDYYRKENQPPRPPNVERGQSPEVLILN